MTVVIFKVNDPSGKPLANEVIYATLLGPALTAYSVDERRVSTRTNISGEAQLELKPNSKYSNLESFYEIAIGNREIYKVVVPDVFTSISLQECLTYVPKEQTYVLVSQEQNLTSAEESQARSNIGLSDDNLRLYSLRSDSICVVKYLGSSYPQPSPGYGAYHYFGPTDPTTQEGLPFGIGSVWVEM